MAIKPATIKIALLIRISSISLGPSTWVTPSIPPCGDVISGNASTFAETAQSPFPIKIISGQMAAKKKPKTHSLLNKYIKDKLIYMLHKGLNT